MEETPEFFRALYSQALDLAGSGPVRGAYVPVGVPPNLLPGVLQAMTTTDDTVRVEWSPSFDDPTVITGLAPHWKVRRTVGIPYRYVFEQIGGAPALRPA